MQSSTYLPQFTRLSVNYQSCWRSRVTRSRNQSNAGKQLEYCAEKLRQKCKNSTKLWSPKIIPANSKQSLELKQFDDCFRQLFDRKSDFITFCNHQQQIFIINLDSVCTPYIQGQKKTEGHNKGTRGWIWKCRWKNWRCSVSFRKECESQKTNGND